MRVLKWALIGMAALGATGGAAAVIQSDPIYNIAASDPEMNAAKARAIAELPDFYRRMASPDAGETQFMVKFDIVPGEEAEFVWAGELDRSTAPMTGVLLNQPQFTDHRVGQRVPIAEADIIDWSFVRGRVLQGAYSDRVLIDRMDPEEAARIRANFGW